MLLNSVHSSDIELNVRSRHTSLFERYYSTLICIDLYCSISIHDIILYKSTFPDCSEAARGGGPFCPGFWRPDGPPSGGRGRSCGHCGRPHTGRLWRLCPRLCKYPFNVSSPPLFIFKERVSQGLQPSFFSPLINSIFAPDKRITVFSNTVSISPKYSITLTLRLAGHRGGKISSLLNPYVLYSKSVHPW